MKDRKGFSSEEGLALKTSAFKFLYSGHFFTIYHIHIHFAVSMFFLRECHRENLPTEVGITFHVTKIIDL